MREENEEYDKERKQLQQAIHANNFKLDEKYKQMVQKGATSIVDSVKEGIEEARKRREEKALVK